MGGVGFFSKIVLANPQKQLLRFFWGGRFSPPIFCQLILYNLLKICFLVTFFFLFFLVAENIFFYQKNHSGPFLVFFFFSQKFFFFFISPPPPPPPPPTPRGGLRDLSIDSTRSSDNLVPYDLNVKKLRFPNDVIPQPVDGF